MKPNYTPKIDLLLSTGLSTPLPVVFWPTGLPAVLTDLGSNGPGPLIFINGLQPLVQQVDVLTFAGLDVRHYLTDLNGRWTLFQRGTLLKYFIEMGGEESYIFIYLFCLLILFK